MNLRNAFGTGDGVGANMIDVELVRNVFTDVVLLLLLLVVVAEFELLLLLFDVAVVDDVVAFDVVFAFDCFK